VHQLTKAAKRLGGGLVLARGVGEGRGRG
jgi:hypothetical protein